MANTKRESANYFSNIATIIGLIYTIVTILQIIEKPIFKIQEIETNQNIQSDAIKELKKDIKEIRELINNRPARVHPLGE